MVPPDSPSNPNIIHEFLISNPSHYESHPFDPYGVDFRNLGSYPSQSVNEHPNIQCLGGRITRSYDLIQAPPMVDEQQLNHQNQKLSLSLGSRLLFPSSSQCSGERCYLASGEELQEKTRKSCDLSQYSTSSSLNQASYTCYGTDSPSLSIASSRYFKPTQSLLEELVSVNEIDLESTNKLYASKLSGFGHHGSLRLSSQLKAELCTNGLSLEKQELEATLGKLISLLEEVERRYEQYYQQLEEVVSSFESNAGLGSGKSYTALAISAMSGHFASLKDAILCQLYATRKKIMQDLPILNTGFSQLGLFDKETNRHNRIALQQLGMMAGPTQTWRPIRGLPETSVMILRSWLFEHFLHPYPNDNEKLLLASQTGLSKNQVSNWFINARVRLWKPMIEEMYKEEFADSSENSNLLSGTRVWQIT